MWVRVDKATIDILMCGLVGASLLVASCVEVSPEQDLGAVGGDSSPVGDTPLRDVTAAGDAPDAPSDDPAPDVTGADSESDTTGVDSAVDRADEPEVVPCSTGCLVAPNDCYEAPGTCQDGRCVFAAGDVGTDCDDADPCTDGDQCDGAGNCDGTMMDCTRPHTEGGTCAGGTCSGWSCLESWGDCNDDFALDGCERPLNTAVDCGECDEPCAAGDHFEADCDTGVCARACDDPWENCDDDWSNGCEIPTGIPNQCDVDGLNPVDGCWTAYCGSLSHEDARNFGSWYCFECTTCHVPSSGRCQWCSHSVGIWFPDDACSCGASEDLICSSE